MSGWMWLAAGLLGGLGALTRFLLDALVNSTSTGSLPLGTFAINISGALALGLLVGLAASTDTLLLAGTATLGAYTTFSTWMLESQRLTEDAELRWALVNLLASVIIGLVAVAAGHALGALA
ncbi:MAG TPA: fluoride efflux transporter CrcB [Solirubrobacteraceae bacterium]|jgi:CrcB protein